MEPLLEPISEAEPCGADLSYEPVYNDLAVMMEGTPENQFVEGSGKDPNWPAVRKLSEESLKRSKDLQIAVYFTVALMQMEGMLGAARGLELIADLVRKYWDALFPALDPDDKDPTQRVNILSQLSVEPGAYGDPIKFIDRLNAAPIFKVPGLAVSMAYLGQTFSGGAAGPAAAQFTKILASGNPEETNLGVDALRRLVAAVHSLDDYLVQTLGRGSAPSFDSLIKAADKGLRLFDEHSGQIGTAAADGVAGVGGVLATGAAGPGQAISGDIRSTNDVRAMLGKIRAYYTVNEPSSPIPLLLERVERLVGQSFLALITNLTPGGRSELDVLMGPQPEAEQPPQ